jgi:predicted XRE-type DNA-binding protein
MRNEDRDNEEMTFEPSSGNVFVDLGLQNADDLLVKADLASAIIALIRQNEWTQVEAAERLGVPQADVSRIARLKTDKFSQERLQTILRRLGTDVEIVLHVRENGGIGTLKVREYA